MTTYAHGGSPEIRPAHWAKPGRKPQPFNPDRCGTLTGYSRHVRTGEPLCDACRKARDNNYREWREKTRRAA
ncbi:hypothetical protein [Pseudarthrobacter cellobiosi]|uniref:hypothetical protein n=1 Tax=Pseudarthrobacter cellobiosi TaxID=2953654 RepID=UPI00208E18BB|nr:hypothetical protein [Pseudarthrobacter sp. HLT1-5]MCO4257372.1 hypothetical protein [Pseudarthrobacter sp. HLT1-5]